MPNEEDEPLSKFKKAAAAYRAAKTVETPSEPDPATWAGLDVSASIPEAEPSSWREFGEQVDALVGDKGPLGLYRELGGKTKKLRMRSGGEVQVSCPLPGHPDNTPSCSINTKTGLWFCNRCYVKGGDAYMMAAVLLGFDASSFKERENFLELKSKIAETYGIAKPEPKAPEPVAPAPDPVVTPSSGDAGPKVLSRFDGKVSTYPTFIKVSKMAHYQKLRRQSVLLSMESHSSTTVLSTPCTATQTQGRLGQRLLR